MLAQPIGETAIHPVGPPPPDTVGRAGTPRFCDAINHDASRLPPVGAFGAGIKLLPKAGIAEQIADGAAVTTSHGVVTTTAAADDLNDEFFDAFAAELAKHRAWDRQTDAVPA